MSKHIKFNKAGRWADSNPLIPQFEVKQGEVREVSNELADIIVEAGRGTLVDAPKPAAASEDDKGADDKAAAEKGKGKK